VDYRRLGRTDEKVSAIGMGTWRIGDYRGQDEKAEQIKAIRRGIELGINLIDTAEFYGGGRSEELVGEAIGGARSSVFIATKVWHTNLHHDDVIAACDRSLGRLGVSQIDLYQVHWPNPKVPIRETMSAMEELVRKGKVRYIGVSNFDIRLAEEAQGALTRSELVSNQVEYSTANRGVEKELLPYCRKEGLTLIAYSPLARGLIPKSLDSSGALGKHEMTPAQAMLSWVTRHEEVVAIPKAGRVEHVEENAAAADFTLSAAEYEAIGNA
jgi:diketogulonate reductase-like aldo/keto reductase